MFRTIIWFIYFWLYMVAVWPVSLRVKRLKKRGEEKKAEELVNRCVHNWASRLLRLAGVKITTQGQENIPEGAAYYAANHQGNFDIPTLLTQLGKPRSIIAKVEMLKLPGLKTWMGFFHCIFLDRENPRQQLKCLTDAQALLATGISVCIFPEGHRSKGGEIGEFKSASFRPALKAGVPIVPVAIEGTYNAMEAHGFRIHPANVYVRILPPVETKDLEKEQVQNIGETIRAVIEKEVEDMRSAAK